ncbi:hypothetical protein LguiA_033153 [Lonicera macranthoides]
MPGHFSVASDVFSFGVLVLEIICGKRNNCFHPEVHGDDFLSHAWKMWKDGTPLELMDPSLADSQVRNEVMRCIQMGLLCVQEDVDLRPSMVTFPLIFMQNLVPIAGKVFLASKPNSQNGGLSYIQSTPHSCNYCSERGFIQNLHCPFCPSAVRPLVLLALHSASPPSLFKHHWTTTRDQQGSYTLYFHTPKNTSISTDEKNLEEPPGGANEHNGLTQEDPPPNRASNAVTRACNSSTFCSKEARRAVQPLTGFSILAVASRKYELIASKSRSSGKRCKKDATFLTPKTSHVIMPLGFYIWVSCGSSGGFYTQSGNTSSVNVCWHSSLSSNG